MLKKRKTCKILLSLFVFVVCAQICEVGWPISPLQDRFALQNLQEALRLIDNSITGMCKTGTLPPSYIGLGRAHQLLSASYTTFYSSGYYSLASKCIINMGICKRMEQNWEKALYYYQMGEEIAIRAYDNDLQIIAAIEQARVYNLGYRNYGKVNSILQKTLVRIKEKQNEEQMAKACWQWCIALKGIGKTDEAMEFIDLATEMLPKISDQKLAYQITFEKGSVLMTTATTLGANLRSRGDYESCVEKLDMALAEFTKAKSLADSKGFFFLSKMASNAINQLKPYRDTIKNSAEIRYPELQVDRRKTPQEIEQLWERVLADFDGPNLVPFADTLYLGLGRSPSVAVLDVGETILLRIGGFLFGQGGRWSTSDTRVTQITEQSFGKDTASLLFSTFPFSTFLPDAKVKGLRPGTCTITLHTFSTMLFSEKKPLSEKYRSYSIKITVR